jgi:hypothetical protein
MNKSHSHKIILARGTQLLLLLSLGCSEDFESEEVFREGEVAPELEASLEDALRTLDSDNILISYDEGSASMEVVVELEQFAELARGFTVEMNVEVRLPDGTVTRHELDWTSGEDLEVPRIALPARETGRYDMALTSLAINGRAVLDNPTPLHSMELLEEGSPASQELQVRPPGGGVGALFPKCQDGATVHGSPYDDYVQGGGRKNKLYGYEGNDFLTANGCADALWGGPGDDALHGGGGYDSCWGGPGTDQFESCEKIWQD